MTDDPKLNLLIVGSGGRVGTLLHRFWQTSPPASLHPIWMTRTPTRTDELTWPASEPPEADAVLALWGATRPDDDLSLNKSLALEAIRLAKSIGATKVLHCSSAAVYGPGCNLSETDPSVPAGAYGQSKVEMEHAVIGSSSRVGNCLMRLANTVGADSLFASLEEERPITLDRFANDLGPVRSYLPLSLLARTVETLLKVDELPETLNVAATPAFDMAELADAAGKQVLWRKAPATAVQSVTLSTARLASLLTEPPAPEAAEIIAEWHRLRQASQS